MSEKDKASPRQRQIMEQRWADAREKCAAKTCPPASRYHVAGCERRNNRMVTLAPEQKVKVTNLNTGVTSEETIVHSDFRAVKEVLEQHEKQAVKLEPLAEAMDVPQEALDVAEPGSGHYSYALPGEEYWDAFERGEPGARGMHVEERGNRRHPVFVSAAEPAPASPWWKFWGRRG